MKSAENHQEDALTASVHFLPLVVCLRGFSSVALFSFNSITVALRYNTRLSLINRDVLCL